MQKIVSWTLLGLGAFLIVAALVSRFWALPTAERTPLDTDTTTILTGEGSGVVVQVGDGEPQPIAVENRTQADADKSDDDVIVFATSTCVVVDEDLGDEYCLGEDDERTVTISADVFATDRQSAEAVELGDYVEGGDWEQKEGLVNKWPFGVEKKDYAVWDSVLGSAVTATYEGTESIDGLSTYKFEYTVEDEETEIAPGLDGTYSQHKVYWIDPKTGAIINQTQSEERLTDEGAVALSLEVGYSDETIDNNVETAKDNGSLLTLLGGWIPLGGGVLGILALAAGALLLVRSSGSGRSGGARGGPDGSPAPGGSGGARAGRHGGGTPPGRSSVNLGK